MPKDDKLGPGENQSPKHKNNPTIGANVKPDQDYIDDSLIGGNKHTSTGGSESEYHDAPGECDKNARKNYGVDSPEGPYFEEFSEGSDYSDRSQGSTLDRGSID